MRRIKRKHPEPGYRLGNKDMEYLCVTATLDVDGYYYVDKGEVSGLYRRCGLELTSEYYHPKCKICGVLTSDEENDSFTCDKRKHDDYYDNLETTSRIGDL